jgi:hypothetical protein
LAGSGAAPEPAGPEVCANAGAIASMVAMAMIVILRMLDALGCPVTARTLKSISPAVEAERTGSDLIRNRIFANLAHEGCILIKLLLRLLHCHNRRIGLSWPLICRGSR